MTATLAPAFLVLATVVIHYEGLQVISHVLVRIALAGRRAMLTSTTWPFLLHVLEV